jgi:hypothetical protein
VGRVLARHATVRRILVTIDGETMVLQRAPAQERDALIETYLRASNTARSAHDTHGHRIWRGNTAIS